MRFLPPEEQAIVDRAVALGLEGASPPPAYLSPQLCTGLSLVLAIPTLGYSLLLFPILWVAQSERTTQRILSLRRKLETDDQEGMVGSGC
jgi:hypothetical protein